MFVGARSLQRKGKKKKRLEKRKTPAEEHRKGDDVLVVQGSLSRLLAQTRLTSRKIASFEVRSSKAWFSALSWPKFDLKCLVVSPPFQAANTPAGVFASKMKYQIEQNIHKVQVEAVPFLFPF